MLRSNDIYHARVVARLVVGALLGITTVGCSSQPDVRSLASHACDVAAKIDAATAAKADYDQIMKMFDDLEKNSTELFHAADKAGLIQGDLTHDKVQIALMAWNMDIGLSSGTLNWPTRLANNCATMSQALDAASSR